MASFATGSDEMQVNATATGDQTDASITALADGGWVTTWTSDDGDGLGVYQRRYAANGTTAGNDTLVNMLTSGEQSSPAITALSDGGWLMTWTGLGDNGGSDLGIFQQRYDVSGAKSGSETQVNSYHTGNQIHSAVTTLADGGWVVTWFSDSQGSSGAVYEQRYDADGAQVDDETQVNGFGTGAQEAPSVTALANGGWVVTWQGVGYTDSAGIYERFYDADGIGNTNGPDYVDTRVNTAVTGEQTDASVAGLADGGWIVTWTSDGQDGSGLGIYQQRYAADGTVAGAETRVNTTTADDQIASSVAALSDGGWLVVWNSMGQDGSDNGIYQQRYDANGNALGGETQVNINKWDAQADATVTALADGSWVVTWTSANQDGDANGIYQRHFAADVRGSALADALTGTAWGEYLVGFSGNDTLDGKGGADIMIGGTGNDIYYVNNAGDKVQELGSQGKDLVLSAISYSLTANVEDLTLTGKGAIDATGNRLANTLTGNASANSLTGGAGADTLIGGKGIDNLYGDGGADTFVFSTGDTGKTVATADIIHAFTTAEGDRIDLSAIDANRTTAGDQAFSFIGTAAFHHHVGELRYETDGSSTQIYGDTNGDGKADLAIHLDTPVTLQAGYFQL